MHTTATLQRIQRHCLERSPQHHRPDAFKPVAVVRDTHLLDASVDAMDRALVPQTAPWKQSKHAQVRQRQRGIAAEVMECLLEWGQAVPAGPEAQMLTFCKKRLKSVSQHWPKSLRVAVEKQRNVYVVISNEGTVITAGHRTVHLHRP